MNPGLPGVGVGALFYVILALLMPLNELRLSLHGRGSRRRWLAAGRQWAIAAGIVLTQVLGLVYLARLDLSPFGVSTDSLPALFDDVLFLVSVSGVLVVVSSVIAAGRLARRR